VINQKENTIKAFGTAMIIVLFLFFCTSISDKSFSPNKHSSQLGSASEFNINNGKAVVVEAFKWSSFQKSFSLIRNLFNDNFKSVADNNKITRSFILLQKTQLSIKPFSSCRFYYHLCSGDDDDLPFLS